MPISKTLVSSVLNTKEIKNIQLVRPFCPVSFLCFFSLFLSCRQKQENFPEQSQTINNKVGDGERKGITKSTKDWKILPLFGGGGQTRACARIVNTSLRLDIVFSFLYVPRSLLYILKTMQVSTEPIVHCIDFLDAWCHWL